MSRVLILGGRGRLGAALARKWAGRHEITALARPDLDVSDLPALGETLKAASYDVLVNGTGLTNVDRCEAAREEAEVVNARAPGVMARAAADKGARFIHFSTDYVFDGQKNSLYSEEDAANPLGHYGETKLAGERESLIPSLQHMAVRVSWIFGPEKASFIDSILERAMTQNEVEAIADKTSCPTYADDVADWLEPFFDPGLPGGLYHACNEGACTWRDYAQHALDWAHGSGRPLQARDVKPLSLADMKNFTAPRPPHTAMGTGKLAAAIGKKPRTWREALDEYLTTKFN